MASGIPSSRATSRATAGRSRIQREVRVGAAGPVREQRSPPPHAGLGRVIRAGQGQRRQPVPGLPGHPQRFPAGRQDPHIIAAASSSPAHSSLPRRSHARSYPAPAAAAAGPAPATSASAADTPGWSAYPERRGHRRRHAAPDRPPRRQLRQPYPVCEPARGPPGHLTGQPGLARRRPARSPSPAGSHPAGPQTSLHRAGPAHETRQRRREAMHTTRRSPRRSPPHARHHNRGQPPTYRPGQARPCGTT